MKTAARSSLLAAFVALGFFSIACTPTSSDSGGSGGSGGSKASSGGSGGSTSSSGGSGGSSGSGGDAGGGGSQSSGGSSGSTGGSNAGSGGSGDTGGSGGSSGGDDAGTGDDSAAEPDAAATGGDDASGAPVGGGSGSKEALLVGGGKGAIDASLMMGLKAKGFNVTMAADTAPASMAMGKGIVVISSTSSRGNLKTTFKDVAVPVIIMKDGAMQMLGMTGGDTVTGTGLKTIDIVMANSPLAAGKTGTVTVYSNSDRMFAAAQLGPDAIKVATLSGMATQWAIFAYPSGGMMVGGKAPAKRVGFFAHQDGSLSADGLALFEAAVDWATSP